MSLTVSEGASGTYSPPEAGTFTATCCNILDLGTQVSTFEGESKAARKIQLAFELTDPDAGQRDDGSRHIIRKRFTASLHAKAGLRKFLESWRGRPFDAQELKGFSLPVLLGKPCLLGIVHEAKGDKVYANLSSVMKLPRGMTAPAGTEQPSAFDMAAPDWLVFSKLGSRLQDQIAESPEFKALQAAGAVPKSILLTPQTHQNAPGRAAAAPAVAAPVQTQKNAPAPAYDGASGFDDMDSDIPF